ncbi:hypothetical protein H6P81_001394 [Aristolochia fimbriata]|uniref:Eukaryotic translation initiation factor 3 subunit I n=1 Tax=Aristolochia fimbriata TaxID=158543 RepID=A0AAV7FAM8_ARIFI|nr:hypothetical protein H6P81_001394 [Aristolochia fimbriata]
MRPILMKGHERPLTFLKYNREGDLLFSCAKDHTPTVWFADNGERLGTYRGHNGAVWCCDVSRDSMRLITGSADQSVKLWNVQTGAQLYSFNFDSPARSVDFSIGDKLAVITTDPFMELPSAIHVKRISRDPSEQTGESVLVIKGPQGRINRAVWGPLNTTIISGGEDAVLRIWDAETGKLLKETDKATGHQKTITSLSKSSDGSHFLSGSLDKSAKLWDIRTLTVVKTYVTERPVNAVAISPLLDHVVLGGGQDASHVTTTDRRAGKFEAKFFHKILQEEIGGVKGHFGPINALAFNPDGRSFSSGGEDGYVRLHHFDPDYFHIKICSTKLHDFLSSGSARQYGQAGKQGPQSHEIYHSGACIVSGRWNRGLKPTGLCLESNPLAVARMETWPWNLRATKYKPKFSFSAKTFFEVTILNCIRHRYGALLERKEEEKMLMRQALIRVGHTALDSIWPHDRTKKRVLIGVFQ